MEYTSEQTEQKTLKKSSKTTKSKTTKTKTEDPEKVVEENLSKIEEIVKNEDIEQSKTSEDVESENHNTEENESSSVTENDYLNKLNNMVENLNFIKKTDVKEFELTKDLINEINKKQSTIEKLLMSVRHSFNDLMVKENSNSLKKSSKKNKVKNTDTSNAPINKKKATYPQVLKFLKFEEDTEVSRAEILQGMNAFIKEQKTNKNPEIFVEGDNSKFVLVGELKVLFDFIKKQMIERGDLKKEEESNFPTFLGYRDIMKYTKYCFPESQK